MTNDQIVVMATPLETTPVMPTVEELVGRMNELICIASQTMERERLLRNENATLRQANDRYGERNVSLTLSIVELRGSIKHCHEMLERNARTEQLNTQAFDVINATLQMLNEQTVKTAHGQEVLAADFTRMIAVFSSTNQLAVRPKKKTGRRR